MRAKILLLYLTTVCTFTAAAQPELGVKVEPMPFEISKYIFEPKAKGIKSLIIISNGDTVKTEYYDRNGEMTKSLGYSRGKRDHIVYYETLNNKKLWQWRMLDLNTNSFTSTSKTLRDANGNDLLYLNRDIAKGDTVSRGEARFTYDDKGRLIKREDLRNNKLVLQKIFTYTGNDLTSARVTSNFDPRVFYQQYDYQYNADHLPVQKAYSLIRFGKPDPAAISSFTYKGKDLAEEQYPDGSMPGKTVTVKYEYDNEHRPVTVTATQDTLYRRINYKYKEGRLVKIDATTNVWLKFGRELLILSASSLTPLPIHYEKECVYDEHSQVTTTKEKINGRETKETRYVREYY